MRVDVGVWDIEGEELGGSPRSGVDTKKAMVQRRRRYDPRAAVETALVIADTCYSGGSRA